MADNPEKALIVPKKIQDASHKELTTETMRLKEKGIDAAFTISSGCDYIEIIKQVLKGGHDLLIKSVDEHVSSLNSTDFKLIRNSPILV